MWFFRSKQPWGRVQVEVDGEVGVEEDDRHDANIEKS